MPNLKYKIGDRVKVRSDLELYKTYSMENNPFTNTVTADMLKWQGKVVTIRHVGDQYALEEIGYSWTDDMFEGLAIEYELPKDCIGLPQGYYKPFEIKRGKKPPRKICAPSDDLLKYQHKVMPSLESKFFDLEKEHKIEGIIHGFVKDRNCVTAASQHVGYDLTIMMDIVAFFDHVTMAHTGVNDENLYSVDGYCAQGFATSPILANIGIIPTVAWIKDYLDSEFKDRYCFTMYADDIQISINSDNFEEETAEIIAIVEAALSATGFQIHPHKTRIRHAKFGYRRILGINVGDITFRATRKTMRKIRAAKHQKNGPSAGGLTTWSKCLLPKKLRPRTTTYSQKKFKMQ